MSEKTEETLEMYEFSRGSAARPYVVAKGFALDGRQVSVCIYDAKAEIFEKAIMARTYGDMDPADAAHIVSFRGEWATPKNGGKQYFRVEGFDIFSGPRLETQRVLFRLGRAHFLAQDQSASEALKTYQECIEQIIGSRPGPSRDEEVASCEAEQFNPEENRNASAAPVGPMAGAIARPPAWAPQFLLR